MSPFLIIKFIIAATAIILLTVGKIKGNKLLIIVAIILFAYLFLPFLLIGFSDM